MASYEFWYVGHHLFKYISPPFLSFQNSKCINASDRLGWCVLAFLPTHFPFCVLVGCFLLIYLQFHWYFTSLCSIWCSDWCSINWKNSSSLVSSIFLYFYDFHLPLVHRFHLCWNPHLFMLVVYIFHYVLSHANHSYLKVLVWLF